VILSALNVIPFAIWHPLRDLIEHAASIIFHPNHLTTKFTPINGYTMAGFVIASAARQSRLALPLAAGVIACPRQLKKADFPQIGLCKTH